VTDRLHAEGGIGQVWLARDIHLNRDVALKTLREEFQHRQRAMRRFLKEAEITGQLEHPGIVPVYELVATPATGRPFYAMRFVRGRTLAKAIRSYHEQRLIGDTDPLTLPALLSALVAICNTVAYAHSRGVVHRDLKGDNVLLGDFGEVIVLDWGVAKVLGTSDDESHVSVGNSDADAEIDQTLQGDVVGTPAFMAPEQANGRLELIDARTDIYGLGAILYEILTGQPPFCGANTVEILEKVRRDDPVPPRLLWPEVPPTLEAACLKALAKDQADRYASATALAEEIQVWQEVQRRRAEEEMRRSRERFELAVRGSQDGLWDWDLQTNEVFFSARWKGILGYEDHEIPNELDEWEKRLHPDERERVLAANFAHITGDTSHYEYEYRLRHKDGSYRWILARGVALRDKSGKAYRMAGSHVDITAWKELESACRRSQQRCHSLMDAAPCGILVVDADDQIREANHVAATLLGLTIEALQGRSLRSLWATAIPGPGDSAASDREPLDIEAKMKSGQECIVGFPRPDSQIGWVSVTATQVSDSADETRKSRYVYFTSAPL
jgi:serine/threonine-protein kinase